MGAHSAENAEVRGVRVPDERLDAREANLTAALTWVPHPYRVPATEDLAALVADLRAARADNQRLREALERIATFESRFGAGEEATLARAALAEEPRA